MAWMRVESAQVIGRGFLMCQSLSLLFSGEIENESRREVFDDYRPFT